MLPIVFYAMLEAKHMRRPTRVLYGTLVLLSILFTLWTAYVDVGEFLESLKRIERMGNATDHTWDPKRQ